MNQLPLPYILTEAMSALVPQNVLPTNVTSWKHPTHRWYNFIAGYSPEFVQLCFEQSALKRESTVLDPFAGCGTTLVAAQAAGMASIGFEPHPFFFQIAKAKSLRSIDLQEVTAIHRAIVDGFEVLPSPDIISADAWTFLGKLFAPEVLTCLLGARVGLERSGLAEHPLAFLILSRLADECSTAQTDGVYKAPSSLKKAAIPKTAIDALISDIVADLAQSQIQNSQEARLFNGSSEDMRDVATSSVDMIVTSPPYLNNFDYAEMTRMHLYFWGIAKSWGDITDRVRARLVTNTTTALKGHRNNQELYAAELVEVVAREIKLLGSKLSHIKKSKKGKKDYDLLLMPYMAQITRVYRECFRVLRPGAKIHTMIADAAFYGVHIPSPQWLAEMLKHIGFSEVQCTQVRKRGHRWILRKREGSPIGLGEYHIAAVR